MKPPGNDETIGGVNLALVSHSTRRRVPAALLAAVFVLGALPADADAPSRRTVWRDMTNKGNSLVIGRFAGKFESSDFRSRRIVMRHRDTGKRETLRIDDGLGLIAEIVKPGVYDVLAIEAVYLPQIRPMNPRRIRPIRQRFSVSPREHEIREALILVPADRPVYIGTIRAGAERRGMVYEGQKLRVVDDFDVAMDRLATVYPQLATSLEQEALVPQRHFMLRPTRTDPPLEAVVGMEDPVTQARRYIEDGKYEQAIDWLSTFMPVSDNQRSEVRLLIGEAHLGSRDLPLAIEELGEVLLSEPGNVRALRLLARAHSLNGDLEDTENLYHALLEMRPRDAEAHLQIGYLQALRSEEESSLASFEVAFESEFDYLMHDLAPFLIAVRGTTEQGALYEPATMLDTDVPFAGGSGSRRSSRNDGILVLIDHRGRVKAAHFAPDSSNRAHLTMLSLVRGRYRPARLNGVSVPSILASGRFRGEN